MTQNMTEQKIMKGKIFENYASGCWSIEKDGIHFVFNMWELVDDSTSDTLIELLYAIASRLSNRESEKKKNDH